MNFCQHRNLSIRHQVSHESGGAPFSLDAAWEDIVGTCNANMSDVDNETFSTFGYSSHAGNYPYCGLILAPGGYIYGVPYGSNKILKIDTNNDTISFISVTEASSSTTNWGGGVYAPNGYIYMLPARHSKILKLNPQTDEITLIDNGPAISTSVTNYLTACCAPNGCVYGCPSGVTKIIKLDTNTDTFTLLDDYTFSVPYWGIYGCSKLGRDGCIYGFPRCGKDIIKINPANDSVTVITAYLSTTSAIRHEGCDIGVDGKLYAMPTNQATYIIEQNTSTDNASITNTSLYGSDAILAPNGRIYCSPRANSKVFRLNTFDGSYTTLTTSYSGYTHNRLAPNGCIYAVPEQGGTKSILKINVNATSNFQETTLLSPFLNNY